MQSRTDDRLTSTVCGSTSNDATLTSPKQIVNPLYISIHDTPTYNPVQHTETSGPQQIADEIIIPTRYTDVRDRINFSVSFDEHELKNYKQDQDILRKAKRLRSS